MYEFQEPSDAMEKKRLKDEAAMLREEVKGSKPALLALTH